MTRKECDNLARALRNITPISHILSTDSDFGKGYEEGRASMHQYAVGELMVFCRDHCESFSEKRFNSLLEIVHKTSPSPAQTSLKQS